MNLSQKGSDLLKSIETLALTPYDDSKPKGTITEWCEGATIGYGHLISKSEWPKYSKGITKEQAEALFIEDAKPMIAAANKVTRPLKVNELDALVVLIFNIGAQAFSKSSLLKMLNGQSGSNYATLEEAWKAFNKDRGQVNKGLVNRRNSEWDIWTKGIYKRW